MNVIVLQPALDDLVELEDYFERISARLAKRFRQCVEKTLTMIVDFPRAAAVIRKRFRIRTILRFHRYGILYRVGRTSIFIHGMFYLPRGPRFWRSRLK